MSETSSRGHLSSSVHLRRAVRWVVVALVLCCAGSVRADDFQVNEFTYYKQQFPDVCSDTDGNFVVVWESYYQDGEGFGIFGRRFDSSRAPLGSEFQINVVTLGNQGGYYGGPAVACKPDLTFVVVWGSYPDYEVFGRRFNSLGIPAGTAFAVNTYNNFNYPGRNNVDVAMASNGSFVVVWDSYYQDGDGYGVFGRRYSSFGSPVGGEFQVNQFTAGDQGGFPSYADLAATMDPAGNFIVAWASYGQDGDQWGVFGQRFNSSGAPAGTEFPINSYTTENQGQSIGIGADQDGNFIIAWNSCDDQDGYYCGVFAKRFDNGGVPAGGEFQVNSFSDYDQGGYGYSTNGVGLAIDSTGGFMVAWSSQYQDGYEWGIFAQRYDNIGAAIGTEFQVNTYTYYRQESPRVAASGSGFVVTWQSYYQDGDGGGVFINGPAGPTQTPTATPTPTAACGATPATCTDPGKGLLLIKDKAPTGASVKDKLIFKWLKGPALGQPDFGNPYSGTTDISVCIYADGNLVATLEAPSGTNWSSISDGYSYDDPSKSSDGIQKLLLKGGAAGKSKIIVKAKDGNIPMPALPLSDTSSVTVQVKRSDSASCWEAVLPASAVKNDSGSFKDKIP